MATGLKDDIELFIEYNEDCELRGLLEWIIELLPQDDFDRYVADIKQEMEID